MGDTRPSLDDCPGQTRREAATQSQGSPGQKTEDRPAAGSKAWQLNEDMNVKANLARFTSAVAFLALMALSLGAGVRWG
jgi:hypothetical protein